MVTSSLAQAGFETRHVGLCAWSIGSADVEDDLEGAAGAAAERGNALSEEIASCGTPLARIRGSRGGNREAQAGPGPRPPAIILGAVLVARARDMASGMVCGPEEFGEGPHPTDGEAICSVAVALLRDSSGAVGETVGNFGDVVRGGEQAQAEKHEEQETQQEHDSRTWGELLPETGEEEEDDEALKGLARS